MKNKLSAIFILIIVIGAIVAGISICKLPSISPLSNPPLLNTTPTTVFDPGPVIIEAIRTEAKLSTIAMTFANDQTVTRAWGLGGVCQEKITYLAYYDVTAGIDLSKIAPEDILIVNGGSPAQTTITITLPGAEITSVTLDTDRSRIVASQPAWVPSCGTQAGDMTVEAQRKIKQDVEKAAKEKGILKQAQEQAGFELQRLLLKMGYPQVFIRYSNVEQAP